MIAKYSFDFVRIDQNGQIGHHHRSLKRLQITLNWLYLPHITPTQTLILNNSKYNHTYDSWGFGVLGYCIRAADWLLARQRWLQRLLALRFFLLLLFVVDCWRFLVISILLYGSQLVGLHSTEVLWLAEDIYLPPLPLLRHGLGLLLQQVQGPSLVAYTKVSRAG